MSTVTVRWRWGDIPEAHVVEEQIEAYLLEIGLAAEAHMAQGMAGSRGGKLYTQELRSRRGTNWPIFPVGARAPHRASAPGQYPAVDTGLLRRMTTNPAALDVSGGGSHWELIWGTGTPYAKWLAPADEGGEPRGPKRLFMRHAVDSTIQGVDPPGDIVEWT